MAFATQPVVEEEDAFGNVITSDSTHTVTAAPGSLGTASLQGSNLTVTLVNGVATFSGLSYNKAETMNLSFTTNAGGVTSATSSNIVVSPAAASQLVDHHAAVGHGDGRRGLRHPAGGRRKRTRSATSITSDSTHTVTAARGSQGTADSAGQQSDGDAGERRGDVQRPVLQQGRDDEPRASPPTPAA